MGRPKKHNRNSKKIKSKNYENTPDTYEEKIYFFLTGIHISPMTWPAMP